LKKKQKSFSRVGLDIGNHSVKFVEMTVSKGKVTLRQALLRPLESQAAVENITPIIKPLLENIKAASEHVRLVLSGSSLLCRCVQMPLMTQNELKGAIRFEAENHIAFPIDDCILDFQILNQVSEKKTMNVLLVAAKRDFIQERVRQLTDLEIRPEAIDVDTFCLVNAHEALGETQEKPFGLLNVGHRVTSFAIMKGGLPLFVREIPLGGAAVTKALTEEKGLGEPEAENYKVAHHPDSLEELKTATHKGFESLAEELKHSLDYFENDAGEPLTRVLLSGGGGLAEAAPAFFTEALGKEVVLWDNLKKLEVDPAVDRKFLEEHAPLFNVAFGLALRG